MPNNYTADDIEHLEGLDSIRGRPELFVGSLQSTESIDILLQESLCVSLDLLLSNQGTELHIELHSDGSATVRDNGPGLPLECLACGRTVTEVIFGSIVPGCRHHKHDPSNSDLCGPGMACVTALSKWLNVNNRRDGGIWQTRYIRGVQVGPAVRILSSDSTGIEISFRPDPEFFSNNRLDFDRFCVWFTSRSFPLPGDSLVTVRCERRNIQATLHGKSKSEPISDGL